MTTPTVSGPPSAPAARTRRSSTACSPPTRRRRTAEASYGALRNEQKELGKAIGPLQGRLKKADDAERPALQGELDTLMSGASDLADRVKGAEAERDAADVEAASSSALSNVVDPAAPVGGEDDFVVLEHVGTPRDFAAEGFTARDHVELGELLGAIDIERGAKVSAARGSTSSPASAPCSSSR